MNKRLLFVYNPHSGKGKVRAKLSEIIEVFTEAGYDCMVHPTLCKEDARNIVMSEGNNYDMIVCSGGDGTLDETISGIIDGNISTPLGYIPAGSTNDFAKSLKIPADMKKAAEHILNRSAKPIDIGLFNGRVFVYIAAFGVFTEVSYATSQEVKNVLGHGAYVLEGVKQIGEGNLRSIEMTIISDDDIIKDTFIYGMVTNTKSVGGMKFIGADEVSFDDGKFEAVFIKFPEDPTQLNAVVASLLGGNPDPELMYCMTTKELIIKTEKPESYTLDGENGGSHTEVEIKVIKHALKMIY